MGSRIATPNTTLELERRKLKSFDENCEMADFLVYLNNFNIGIGVEFCLERV